MRVYNLVTICQITTSDTSYLVEEWVDYVMKLLKRRNVTVIPVQGREAWLRDSSSPREGE